MTKKVYAFDFDGTLTTKDTLLAFIRYAKGTGKTILGALLFSPILLLMRLHLYPNWKAKQQVFSYFFKGMEIGDFNDLCKRFAHDNRHLLRAGGQKVIGDAIAEGSDIVIISASIENWVRPFFEDTWGNKVLIECTRIDVRHDKVTGKFLTKNCYGSEKLKRLQRLFPHRRSYELIAFGDTRGDKQMLEYADKSYYKPFRR